MKRILFPAALVLALSGGLAFAQAPATPQQAPAPVVRPHEHHAQDPHRAAMHLSKQLNLTADQTAKIEPIFASRDEKMAALRSPNAQADPKTLHKQFHAIQRDTEQQLAGVLTPEQLEQMKSMHHGGHHGPPPQAAPQAPTAL